MNRFLSAVPAGLLALVLSAALCGCEGDGAPEASITPASGPLTIVEPETAPAETTPPLPV